MRQRELGGLGVRRWGRIPFGEALAGYLGLSNKSVKCWVLPS